MIISALSCSSNNDDIIPKAESYLKNQLKDPSSYQLIESKIVDTTMKSEYLKKQYSKDSSELEHYKFMNNDKFTKDTLYENLIYKYEESTNLYLRELKELKQDFIHVITVRFYYRAKNGYAALDKYTEFVDYYPGDNSLKIHKF